MERGLGDLGERTTVGCLADRHDRQGFERHLGAVDLTSFVTGDGVVSLRVSSTNSNGADYASKEGAATTRPQLIVTTG